MDHIRPVVCPVIVGRDDMLDLADRRIREVLDGRGHLLFVAGEAGIGKTRLLAAIERRAAAAGFRTVRAGTYPSDLQVSGAIFVDLARAMQRTPPFEAIGMRLAARLEDDVATGDPHRRRRLLVLDVADIVAEAADADPATIVLEDLHWADDLTLEILAALARLLPDRRLLAIATYRSDELYPRVPMRDWRSRLLAQRLAEEVRLERLSERETAAMIDYIGDAATPVPSEIATAIHLRTDGIPLHVEELLGVIGAAELSAPDLVQAAGVPDTVEDAIVARLELRSRRAGVIAQAGAVIGRSFDLDMLAAVVDEDPNHLSRPLGELADHFILLPTHTPGRLGFRHGLICDAIYDRIPEPERRRLHLRTAEAAAARRDLGTDAFLSLHYERAGRKADAFSAALAGARMATGISSHGEARELFERAIRTAPDDLEPAERGRLYEEYARSCAASDQNDVASDAYEDARAAYLEAGRPLDAAAVVGPLVAVRHLLGDGLDDRTTRLRAALGELEVAPSLHQPSSDPAVDRVRARLLAGLAAAYMLDRRLEDGIAFATEARRLATAVDDVETASHAATTLGSCFVFAGRMDEGWRLLDDAVATARGGHHESETARAYRMVGTAASVLVEYTRAERWLREGIEFAERVELWNHRHYMAAHLAHVLWATGRWDDAVALAAVALADGRGGVTTRITALHVLGYVALGRGDWARARTALTEARDLGARMRELQRLSPALWGLAEVASMTGDTKEAIDLVEEGFAVSDAVADAAYLYPFVVTGTRVQLAAGDPLAAARWLERAGAVVSARDIPGTMPAIDHARGLLHLAGGSTAEARVALESAVDAWSRSSRRWEGTWARVDLARCHLRSNRRQEAARVATVARDAAYELGSVPLQEAAESCLGGARRGEGKPEVWAPLTAREFEVARLVATGMTNPEIAGELGVTRKTVSAHLEHITAKLGVGRRAEVAAWVAPITVLHSRPHGDDREE